MRPPLSSWFLATLVLVLCLCAGRGAIAGIAPPFGLRWGESKEDVISQMAKAGVEVLKRPKVSDREVLAIEGITQPSLKQTIAYFDTPKSAGLVEVELQYGDPEWTFDGYRAFVVSVTRHLRAYYGEPTVLERDRRPQGNTVETVAGYQWQNDTNGVLLFFYSVEQGKNVYTTVSIHYRAALPEAPPAASSTPEKLSIPDKLRAPNNSMMRERAESLSDRSPWDLL
jgi:hypothetical protein